MKKAVSGLWMLIFLAFFANCLSAQPAFSPENLTHPIVPGERDLEFTMESNAAPGNVEAWVFYSKNQNDLSVINSGSFTQGKSYGRAIMLKTGNVYECHFVFPHLFHAQAPTGDLFHAYAIKNTPGLVSNADFPQPVSIMPGIFQKGTKKIDFNPQVIKKGECVFYRILKRIKSGNAYTDAVSEIKKFRMPDSFNIGIAGDSYSSGEGAPEDEFEGIAGNNSDMWTSCKCHRSKKSGFLRAVKKYIDEFPEYAVDYSFQACSGATTFDLYDRNQQVNSFDPGLALYLQNCGGGTNEKQFARIANNLLDPTKGNHDEIHMLLMSIGGNNSGFGDIVTYYLVAPLNLAALDAGLKLINVDVLHAYKDKLNGLADDYDQLNNGINQFFTAVRPIVGITTYPDPTRGTQGRCGQTSLLGPSYPCARHENEFLISPQAEYQMIFNDFYVPLNEKVRAAAGNLNWNIIELNQMAGNSGLCNCKDPFFNTIDASYATQGDIFGIVHPNSTGYKRMYKDKVFDFISAKYDQYRDGYYLAILLGLKEAPAPCLSGNLTLINTGILVNKINSKVQNGSFLKGFEGLVTAIKSPDISKPAAVGDIDALSRSTTLSNIKSNAAYKAAFNNLPVKNTIVKTPVAVKSFTSPKPLPKPILVLKGKLDEHVKSAEFKKKLDELKTKLKTAVPNTESDPLDNLYNKAEN